MIWKAYQFKTLDFTDARQCELMQASEYAYPLQKVDTELWEHTQTSLNENYHGGLLSKTLLGVRYFNFEGIAVGMEKELRGTVQNLLRKELQVEANPQNNPYYNLYWQMDDGTPVFCRVKVTKPVSFTNNLGDIQLPYKFQLASPSEKYYGVDLHVVKKQLGNAGGTTLATWLGVALGGYGKEILVENKGNRQAPIKIEVLGYCTNLKLLNLTNKQKFRVEAITTEFVYDNTNSDFDPNKELVVEDKKQNIKPKRSTGNQIFFEPWWNRLVVITDNPAEKAEVILSYRDTYC